MRNIDKTDFFVKRVKRFDRLFFVKPKRIYSAQKAKAKIDCNLEILS